MLQPWAEISQRLRRSNPLSRQDVSAEISNAFGVRIHCRARMFQPKLVNAFGVRIQGQTSFSAKPRESGREASSGTREMNAIVRAARQ